MTEQRLDWHLWNWANWMRRDAGVVRGYAGRASGGLRGNGTTGAFEEECYAVDLRCARAVDAAIEGLPSPEKVAVYHYNLGALRHGVIGIGDVYDEARERLRKELTRRGID